MNFHLIAKPVHPEFVSVCSSRHVDREHYRLRLCITTDGHLITFSHDQLVYSEIAAASSHTLPEGGRLISHVVGGSTENGPMKLESGLDYESSVSMDLVDPKMFVTIQQQLDKRVETDGLVHRFESNGRLSFGAISYMHVQSFIHHVRIRAFHTFPETCAVLKTNSVFRLASE